MDDSGPTRIVSLYRYPLKGFAGEPLETVQLTAGECVPFDRAFAVENGGGRFDPADPKPLPKVSFLMLMRNERLATLGLRFDEATGSIALLRNGKQVAAGNPSTKLGRQLLEQFLAAYFKVELRGPPRLVSAPGHMFSDVPAKVLHIVNLATLRDLERMTSRSLDPLRFRANIYVDGLAPWKELDLVDKRLHIGDVELEIIAQTERCEAVNVDPGTAVRDTSIPSALIRAKGHSDFGVYARVITGGSVNCGQTIHFSPT